MPRFTVLGLFNFDGSAVTKNLKNFLLRGSTLRNTNHVIGLVVPFGRLSALEVL